MYLHKEDRELLHDIIVMVSEKSGIEENIIEKDYYVTLLLKELARRNSNVVFKGGTSLSKAYHVIDRFSEDIDITFDEHMGESRRKKIKYELLKSISDEVGLPIDNWDGIESDKDYNHYDFLYDAMSSAEENILRPYVKLETALMSYAYPTQEKEIASLIYDYLKESDPEIISEYSLEPFRMKVQALTRTFVDKLFAVCDYYMNGKATRNSRHLYDIYKLYPHIAIDEKLRKLVGDVREHRANMDVKIAPSARYEVDITQKVREIVESGFYVKDYEDSTKKLIGDNVGYEEVIKCYSNVMQQLFDE